MKLLAAEDCGYDDQTAEENYETEDQQQSHLHHVKPLGHCQHKYYVTLLHHSHYYTLLPLLVKCSGFVQIRSSLTNVLFNHKISSRFLSNFWSEFRVPKIVQVSIVKLCYHNSVTNSSGMFSTIVHTTSIQDLIRI